MANNLIYIKSINFIEYLIEYFLLITNKKKKNFYYLDLDLIIFYNYKYYKFFINNKYDIILN